MGSFERDGTTVISPLNRPRAETVSLRVDDGGICFDGKRIFATEDIASVTLGLDERTMIHVRSYRGILHSFPFTSEDDAHALLDALGRTPDRTIHEVALEPSLLGGGFRRWPGWMAAATMAAKAAVLLFSRASSDKSMLETTLEIGADGLRLRGALADEWLPHEALAEVSSRVDSVVLRLREGDEIVLPLIAPSRLPEVVVRVSHAIAEARAGTPVDDEVLRMLGAIAGSAAEKVAALRAIGTEAGAAYRAPRVPRERLWSLVLDPSVPGAMRVRAAVALSDALSPEEKQRLRIVADGSVRPKVRSALDAVARGDERLARKLAEVESERSTGVPKSD